MEKFKDYSTGTFFTIQILVENEYKTLYSKSFDDQGKLWYWADTGQPVSNEINSEIQFFLKKKRFEAHELKLLADQYVKKELTQEEINKKMVEYLNALKLPELNTAWFDKQGTKKL